MMGGRAVKKRMRFLFSDMFNVGPSLDISGVDLFGIPNSTILNCNIISL